MIWAGLEEVKRVLDQAAQADSKLILYGESGTGKTRLAKYVHEQSARNGEPFTDINCAAIPADLLESELFGHKRGAFTGATHDKMGLLVVAGSGTFFMDEVAELSLAHQAKLLRALDSHQVRPVGGAEHVPIKCRVIAATNQDLPARVAAGSFRFDLYYRLNVIEVVVPPLRDRRDAILPLAEELLAELRAQGSRKYPAGFSNEAKVWLQGHRFSGNIRELANLVERGAVVGAGSAAIEPAHMRSAIEHGPPTAGPPNERESAELRDVKDVAVRLLGFEHLPPEVQEGALLLARNLRQGLNRLTLGLERPARKKASRSMLNQLCIPEQWPAFDLFSYGLAIAMRWDLAENHDVEVFSRESLLKIYGTGLGKSSGQASKLRMRLLELVRSPGGDLPPRTTQDAAVKGPAHPLSKQRAPQRK